MVVCRLIFYAFILVTSNLSSHPLHKTIHHPLLSGPVEGDGEPVAIDAGDVGLAEFPVGRLDDSSRD
jgi:hypothetical protein